MTHREMVEDLHRMLGAPRWRCHLWLFQEYIGWHVGYAPGPVFRIWWLGFFEVVRDMTADRWWKGWSIDRIRG